MEPPYQEDPIARTTKPFIAPGKSSASEMPKRPLGLTLIAVYLGCLGIVHLTDMWSIISEPTGYIAVLPMFVFVLHLGLAVLYFVTIWGLWSTESLAIKLTRWIIAANFLGTSLLLLFYLFGGPKYFLGILMILLFVIVEAAALFYLFTDRVKKLL